MRLFLLLMIVPIIEIALFIQVGSVIGTFPTLTIVILTALLGSFLLRTQGSQVMNQLRDSFSALQDPSEPLAHGAMILFAGALLLTPGFFTDAFGLSLMIPQVRSWIFNAVRSRVTVQSFGAPDGQAQAPGQPTGTVDGEFEEVSNPQNPTPKPTHDASGWTRH